jgi:hypothetical protein
VRSCVNNRLQSTAHAAIGPFRLVLVGSAIARPEVVVSVCWTVSFARGDVDVCMDDRANVHLNRTVPSALESDRAVVLGLPSVTGGGGW